MDLKCDKEECDETAEWTVYAAYPLETRESAVHPQLARYPMPMIRACSTHVIDMLMDDTKKLATTAQWVIKPALRITNGG